jgi:hypothetical protein
MAQGGHPSQSLGPNLMPRLHRGMPSRCPGSAHSLYSEALIVRSVPRPNTQLGCNRVSAHSRTVRGSHLRCGITDASALKRAVRHDQERDERRETSMADMIAGNPRANRTGLCIAIALLFIALLSIALVALLRKRTDPEKEPPLHPAGLIAMSRFPGMSIMRSGESGANARNHAAVASEATQLRSARKP